MCVVQSRSFVIGLLYFLLVVFKKRDMDFNIRKYFFDICTRQTIRSGWICVGCKFHWMKKNFGLRQIRSGRAYIGRNTSLSVWRKTLACRTVPSEVLVHRLIYFCCELMTVLFNFRLSLEPTCTFPLVHKYQNAIFPFIVNRNHGCMKQAISQCACIWLYLEAF